MIFEKVRDNFSKSVFEYVPIFEGIRRVYHFLWPVTTIDLFMECGQNFNSMSIEAGKILPLDIQVVVATIIIDNSDDFGSRNFAFKHSELDQFEFGLRSLHL